MRASAAQPPMAPQQRRPDRGRWSGRGTAAAGGLPHGSRGLLRSLLVAGACVAAGVTAAAATAAEPDIAFFESRIRPVLVEHCQRCHGEGEPKAGLRVDSRAGLLAGGDSGPAVAPGDPAASLLMAALRHDGIEMPPQGPLPAHVIADFETWISRGAADPRSGDAPADRPTVDVEAGRAFWAFRPLATPTVPAVRDPRWPLDDVDRFVLAELDARGGVPASDADRETWLRRVTFDLIGLPPTLEEIDAFVADGSSQAFEAVIDRLLDSDHFGERWGRHWLDLARFAESSGGGRSLVFPQAWRYRDWVTRAFNQDLPFDRFITAQIAGDLLPHATPEQEHDHLVATGYLLLGPHNYEAQDKRLLEMDVADEQIDTIGRGLLGMSLGCARCHDHKFDPVPQTDYYALAGILRSTDVLVHENVSRWTERPLPVPPETAAAVAAHDARAAAARGALAAAKRALAALDPDRVDGPLNPASLPGIVLDDVAARRVGAWAESRFVKRHIGAGYLHDADAGKGEKTLTFQPEFPWAGRYEVRLAYTSEQNRAANVPVSLLTLDGEAERTVDMRQSPPIDGRFISLGVFRFDPSNQWFVQVSNAGTRGHVVVDAVQFLPVDEEAGVVAGAEREPHRQAVDSTALAAAKAEVARLEKAVKQLAREAPVVPRAMAAADATTIADIPLRIRGEVHRPGPVVPRGVLTVATHGRPPSMPSDSSGRLELAAWITSAENPLTARVYVNRVWHWLFGAGLVRTVDNFGTTGEPPSHPALLDHLARRFIADGWSTKRLIRMLVLSRTYRQATTGDPWTVALDPENRLLGRMNRRRLDAESLRDAMLAVAGTLDRRIGGSGITDEGVLGGAGKDAPTEYAFEFTGTRRSLYVPAFRNRRMELLEAFDAADPNAAAGARNISTVAPQALLLLNGPFVMEQASAAAGRLLAAHGSDEEFVERAFRSALGRRPTVAERAAVRASLRTASETDDPQARRAAWERVMQALFACVDFRTLE